MHFWFDAVVNRERIERQAAQMAKENLRKTFAGQRGWSFILGINQIDQGDFTVTWSAFDQVDIVRKNIDLNTLAENPVYQEFFKRFGYYPYLTWFSSYQYSYYGGYWHSGWYGTDGGVPLDAGEKMEIVLDSLNLN